MKGMVTNDSFVEWRLRVSGSNGILARRTDVRLPRAPLTPAALAILSAVALSQPARAKCAFAAAWASPARGPIPTNGRVLFEAFGAARPDVDVLSSLHPRLVAGADVVPLSVVETHDGDFAVRQAVLAPTRPLRPGATYSFRVDALPSGVSVSPVDYEVAPGADAKPPVWSGRPRVISRSWSPLGCGPEVRVQLAVPVTDDMGPLYVEAQVSSGKQVTTYVVPVVGGTVDLGHGMCSGPFAMLSGATYAVHFRALDAAGHAAPMPGAPLVVAAPVAGTP
jgi:hypothetical protein